MKRYVVYHLDTKTARVVAGKSAARVEKRLGPAVMDRCVVHVASERDLELVKQGLYVPPGQRRPVSETLKRMKAKGLLIPR